MDTRLTIFYMLFIAGGLLALLLIVALAFRNRANTPDVSEVIRSFQEISSSMAGMAEKLSHIETVLPLTQQVQLEVRSISQRVQNLEQENQFLKQSLNAITSGVSGTGAIAGTLAETASAIVSDLKQARESLSELQASTHAWRELEQQTASSVKRLEMIIAGTYSKGNAGENLVDLILSELPAAWQVRNFRVGNRVVEYGIRLPNQLVVPIDSKWTATSLIEKFQMEEKPEEQAQIKAQIEAAVLARVKEVRKYLDPALTMNFAVAAVPDAVFELCSNVQVQAFQNNVSLVSYSMLIPYLLLIIQAASSGSASIDQARILSNLQALQDNLRFLQDELDGRFARALTMLNNTRTDMGALIARLSSSLATLKLNFGSDESPAPSE